MQRTEICVSPVQDDGCESPIKGLPEESWDDDTPGYLSYESDADAVFEADVDGESESEDEFECPNTYDSQRSEIGHKAPLVQQKTLPDLPPIPTNKLSRKFPPLKRVLSRVFPENGNDSKSSASMTSRLSRAQHDLAHMFARHDLSHSGDTQGASSSSYEDSSSEASPTTSDSHLSGAVTITDVFEHPTHTVTRTVIRPSPTHSLFSLPFKRSSAPSSFRSGSKTFFRVPEHKPTPEARSAFEQGLDADSQRWEDQREGRKAVDIYIVVDREAYYEENWRSLVQEVHYNRRRTWKKISSECGRW